MAELSPDLLGRLGAVALALTGFTLFLQGFFRLDCQAIDAGCENTSWHSEAHSWATGVSTAFLFAAPLLLGVQAGHMRHSPQRTPVPAQCPNA